MYIYRLLRTSLYPLTCPIVRFFQTGALLNSETKIGNTTAKITEEPCRQFKHASLGERSIIRISGSDAISFVQGLITNDVNHLMDNGSTAVSRSCIYTFMLNSSGRIITDLFIYCPNKTDELLLEVDSDLVIRLCSLLKRYKIRRKVEIQHDPTYKISVIYPEFPESCQIVSIGTNVSTVNDKYMIVNDPRCIQIGYRIVNVVANSSSSPSVTPTSIFTDNNEFFKSITIENVQSTNYRYYRYRLGLGEGSLDFPPESIFPFEANADLLNAISFQKGCYLGQELTARTYHTGVIRKRMVPIQFLTDDDIDLSNLSTQNVISEKKRIIGKFRTNFGKYGLASLKYVEIFNENSENYQLKLDQTGHFIRTWKPFWWPDQII
ncbi:hypothetical protein RDWZM_006151 [Blomia tropicalis]|uniref:CAF17 C-terminal domain-containing protein n=1 Tax=Blomia tropicalis TaxID=40697 RepID=A0A9Q0M7E1_BLOTA|nr:hypothetical protein RDWZM_006151 [Blomia tropicalis]